MNIIRREKSFFEGIFISKIKEGESLSLENSLKTWEASAEKDMENLFVLMGKEKPALVPYFKNGEYNGFNFRYQTISKNDLGEVYSIINENNFIFHRRRFLQNMCVQFNAAHAGHSDVCENYIVG